ncbi:sulfite exporter TauE/SafE family protein [Glaciecola sp. XM2]|jgi:sulfite exporter TauE/SafE|uniref:sulfite exporter TauE/SafE family protein n=1 Tax=Glaciecola sp. XM2 TaxID=1914931 RepID=UPI001BDDEC6A|nr:sulfite exporter TauE/SafE family protein [Glaciecola sp. XM2]MBT1449636.1 sulfite exporter TauE/SafE family protein [Glaciecola sp. XM2]
MNEFSLVTAFLIGLAGGVHCIGMCGGIASAFSFAISKDQSTTWYILAYNIGRISSYTIAGAITGYLGSIATSSITTTLPILNIISAVFLILLALYISDWYKGLSALERLGGHLWRRIQPYSKKLIPFKHPGYAIGYGAIWGWLPCGLVYSALTWSLASGSASSGALFMLMFGLGTFPALIATSLGASFLIPILQNPMSRMIIALILITFAIFLLLPIFQGIK